MTKRQPANNNGDLRKGIEAVFKPPKKTEDWQGWKDRIWVSLHDAHPYEPGTLAWAGLAALEQYMHRSKKERRCIECGDPGTVQCQSRLVQSVDFYWMCADCSAWWQHKSCTKRSHKRCLTVAAAS